MVTKIPVVSVLSTLVLASVAFAAPPEPKVGAGKATAEKPSAEKEEKKLPKSGSLSTARTSGSVNAEVPDLWGGNDPTGKEVAPIAGSVSRVNPQTWRMRVFNNTEDTYSVSLEVVQRSDSGGTVRSDSYSYTLKGKDSRQQDIAAGIGSEEAELRLRSYKNLSEKKRTPTPSPDAPGSAQP